MKCVHCGIALDDSSMYCNACGTKTLRDAANTDIENRTAEYSVHSEEPEESKNTLSNTSLNPNTPTVSPFNETCQTQQDAPQEPQEPQEPQQSYFSPETPQFKTEESPIQAPRQSNISVEKDDRSKPLSLSQLWFIEIISLIPGIGFIVLCILALGGNFNQNRTRLAQAKLLVRFMLVSFFLLLSIWFLFMVNYYGTDFWAVLDSWLP